MSCAKVISWLSAIPCDATDAAAVLSKIEAVLIFEIA
jgi:hypothetical protein